MSVQLTLQKASGNCSTADPLVDRQPVQPLRTVINGTCYSSSIRDGGVRGKVMALPAHKWDVIDLPWADEYAAQQWFDQHAHDKYGWIDLMLCQFSACAAMAAARSAAKHARLRSACPIRPNTAPESWRPSAITSRNTRISFCAHKGMT